MQQENTNLTEIYAADTKGSYIKIEIVDYFGHKKVFKISPYFENQQLTKAEFSLAIKALQDDMDKATSPLK